MGRSLSHAKRLRVLDDSTDRIPQSSSQGIPMFKACVLAHSISPQKIPILTFGVEFPREILAEMNTS